jgi:hypothetical protein
VAATATVTEPAARRDTCVPALDSNVTGHVPTGTANDAAYRTPSRVDPVAVRERA